MIRTKDIALGYFFLRVGTGINLFIHGYVRVGEGYEPFRDFLYTTFATSPMPEDVLWLASYLIPWTELFVGGALVLGIFTRLALSGAATLMLALLAGMASLQKWDIVGSHMLYLLVYFALFAFLSHDRYSVDGWYRE